MDLEPKQNRAMKFLKEKGHAVTQSGDGHNLTVDNRNYKILELHELAVRGETGCFHAAMESI